jgi:hypothetical protein
VGIINRLHIKGWITILLNGTPPLEPVVQQKLARGGKIDVTVP